MVLGFGSYNYVFYLLLTWLPSYLSSALHIDLLHSFLCHGCPLAGRDCGRSPRRRLAGGCANRARTERECRAKGRSRGRNYLWIRHPGSSQYAQRDDGADLDQPLDWRPFGCVCSGVVGSVVDRSAQQRWPGGWNHQLLKPAFRHLCTDHYRISGCCSTIVRAGFWSIGSLSIDWYCRLYIPAWPNRTHAGLSPRSLGGV